MMIMAIITRLDGDIYIADIKIRKQNIVCEVIWCNELFILGYLGEDGERLALH